MRQSIDTENMPRESCEHQWDGPWEYEKDFPAGVIMASVTCSKCGMTVLDHEIMMQA